MGGQLLKLVHTSEGTLECVSSPAEIFTTPGTKVRIIKSEPDISVGEDMIGKEGVITTETIRRSKEYGQPTGCLRKYSDANLGNQGKHDPNALYVYAQYPDCCWWTWSDMLEVI